VNVPHVQTTGLDGVLLIVPVRHGDARGFFSETYNRSVFRQIGVNSKFIQDNHSLSRLPGTVRGLHFQIAPFAQAKLVRVLRGAVCDVAVDLRRSSPTYGHSFAAMLTTENRVQLFVPVGFAHGYCTLEPDTEVFYKVDAPYSREHERGLRWDDPALGIDWPLPESGALLLDRDRLYPTLDALPAFFD
jgi:dTDP-4-dehydrorhamnose 3,5-epimerase